MISGRVDGVMKRTYQAGDTIALHDAHCFFG